MEKEISDLMMKLKSYWEQHSVFGLSQDTLNHLLNELHQVRMLVDEIETTKSLELSNNLAMDANFQK